MSREKSLEQFVLPERLERLNEVASKRTSSLTVILDRVHNDHNISAVLRSADAFGLRDVHIVAERFDYSSGITLGAERWLNIERHEAASIATEKLLADNYQIVVLQPEALNLRDVTVASIPVFELPFEKRLALVFGNEVDGVSKEFAEAASLAAHIPMFGFVESFNISVAAAITLFCSSVSGVQGKRPVAELSASEKEGLVGEWLKADVRESEAILRELEARQLKK